MMHMGHGTHSLGLNQDTQTVINALIIITWVPSCKTGIACSRHSRHASMLQQLQSKADTLLVNDSTGLRRVAHLLQASHEALLQFLQTLLLVHPPVTPLQPSSAPDNSSFVGLVPCWRLLPEQREEIMQIIGEMDVFE